MHSFSEDLLESYIVDPTGLDSTSRSCVETHIAACDECRCAAELLADFYADLLLEPAPHMRFGGDTGPCAFVELRSLGLPADRTPALSEALCALLQRTLHIPPDRVFINFADIPRPLWGWNSRTF